jgi:hypothetical protein
MPAVFAQARRIALDVAGIKRRLVKRRREQQRQTNKSAAKIKQFALHPGAQTKAIALQAIEAEQWMRELILNISDRTAPEWVSEAWARGPHYP